MRDEEKEQFLEILENVGNDSTSTRRVKSLVSEADMYATKHELVRGFMESPTLTEEGQADNPP